MFRFLPHTADTSIEIVAPSVKGVFDDATSVARVLFAGEAPERPSEQCDISLDATEYADLLYRYLRELVVWFQVDAFIPGRLETVVLREDQLVGVVHGERFVQGVHDPQPEVKAVTRHQLSFEKMDTGWRATVVLDL